MSKNLAIDSAAMLELSARVAEKVMGWRNVRLSESTRGWIGGFPDDDDGDRWAIPCFHKFIDLAWEVLTKIAIKKHWSFTISFQEGYDSGPLYFVTIHNGKQKREADSRYGDNEDSLPLAICRAALAVVESAG